MHTEQSIQHSAFDGRPGLSELGEVRKISIGKGKDFEMEEFEKLRSIGIGFKRGVLKDMMQASGMDTAQALVSTASIPTPVQFLQEWLPGQVEVVTAKRQIDTLIGISTVGSWEDEQIVQAFLENTGSVVPYSDITNVPLADWNQNFVTRTVWRGELGMRVGNLEEARSGRVRVNSAAQKRQSAGTQLEIARNTIGFYGYNGGNDNTYGFLNDPNLPSYVTVALGAASSTLWSKKTSLEIQTDILTALVGLRTQSNEIIDPYKTPITLAVATNVVDYLSTSSTFNISTKDWLAKNYPLVRVESAPQLNAANGGANVFYAFADMVEDGSSDDRRTFIQVVPAKFIVTGIQKLSKGYEEDYTNATAGVLLKRPYAVYRASGI